MWDNFWRAVIFVALVAALTTCASCSLLGGGEMSDEDLIEAVSEAGCHLKTVKREDGEIEHITCHETVRYIR